MPCPGVYFPGYYQKSLEEIDRQLDGSANAFARKRRWRKTAKKIFVCDEIDTLIALTNEIAPEHVRRL